MTIELAKDSIDIGIVTANGPAMLAFYRETLGFDDGASSWSSRAATTGRRESDKAAQAYMRRRNRDRFDPRIIELENRRKVA